MAADSNTPQENNSITVEGAIDQSGVQAAPAAPSPRGKAKPQPAAAKPAPAAPVSAAPIPGVTPAHGPSQNDPIAFPPLNPRAPEAITRAGLVPEIDWGAVKQTAQAIRQNPKAALQEIGEQATTDVKSSLRKGLQWLQDKGVIDSPAAAKTHDEALAQAQVEKEAHPSVGVRVGKAARQAIMNRLPSTLPPSVRDDVQNVVDFGLGAYGLPTSEPVMLAGSPLPFEGAEAALEGQSIVERVPAAEAPAARPAAQLPPPTLEMEPATPKTPQDIVEGQGLTYKGELTPNSDVHMFEHPNHPGMTAALAGHLTEDTVRDKMAAKLEEFGVKPTEPTHVKFDSIGGTEVAPPSDAARESRTFGKEEAPVTEAPAPEFESTLVARGQLPGQTINLSPAYGDTGGYVGGLVEHRIPGATSEEQKANYMKSLGPYQGSGLMDIPQHLLSPGSTTHDVITHEVAHAVVADLMGLPTEGAEVMSHMHPEAGRGSTAAIAIPLEKIPGTIDRGTRGVHFPRPVLEENFLKLMTTYLAGGVAQDIIHRLPMETNPGLHADYQQVAHITKLMGFTEDESSEMIRAAEQRARDILSHPATADAISLAASGREPNLSKALHMSAAKVQDTIQKVRAIRQKAGLLEEAPHEGDITRGKSADVAIVPTTEAGGAGESAVGDLSKGDGEAVSGKVKPSEIGPEKTPFSGTHYSTLPDQTTLKGSDRGRAAAGSEKDRLQHSNAVPGVYVYREGAKAEPQIGTRANKYPVSGNKAIADIGGAQKQMFADAHAKAFEQYKKSGNNDTIASQKATNDAERALKNAGFDGYENKADKSGSVFLFGDQPVDETVSAVSKSSKEPEVSPNKTLQTSANRYTKANDMPKINHEPVEIDPARAKEIAEIYDEAQHDPNNPQVKAAYDALKTETLAQFNHLRNDLGLKFEPQAEDPYQSAGEMMNDIKQNNRLKVFTGSGPGADHPLSEVEPTTGQTYNTIFRWVHDALGHAAGGNDFSESGEKSATEAHAQMYSDKARPAMRAETEGQTSWFFHNPEVEAGRKEPGEFAPQKATLLPDISNDWHEKAGKAAAKTDAGGINPRTGKADKTGVGLEIMPELRRPLDHVPTASDFQQFYAKNKTIFDQNPDLRIGWDNNSTVPGGHEINIGAVGPEAARVAKKLDQRAAFDIAKGEDIPTGGTGLRTEFPNYSLEDRMKDLRGEPQSDIKGFEHISKEIYDHLEPDEKAYVKGDKNLQRNVMIQYHRIQPSVNETTNAMQAGAALGGWWQRYIDTFHGLLDSDAEKVANTIGPSHAEVLKQWHAALSANKSVEDANNLSWHTYADWLDAGKPTDRVSLNNILKQNGAQPEGVEKKGNAAMSDTLGRRGKLLKEGTDTSKLFNLVNSPEMKGERPFHGDVFSDDTQRNPLMGKGEGYRKVPSMGATVAGKGNLNRLVIDTHIRDFYGQPPKGTAANYIADSVHLRQAAEALGLKGGEGQEQLWGTVLGLKTLLKQGLTAEEAGVKLSSDVIKSIGKDYAEVIANDPEITRPGGVLDRLQERHGIGRGSAGVSAAYSPAPSTSASQGGPGSSETPISTSSLGKSAQRIRGQISDTKIKKPAVSAPTKPGKVSALDLISALGGLKKPAR